MHLIKICCGRACTERFAEENVKKAEKILNIKEGDTNSAEFQLEKVPCMGNCDNAPNVLFIKKSNSPLGSIFYEERLEEKVYPPRFESLLKQLQHDT